MTDKRAVAHHYKMQDGFVAAKKPADSPKKTDDSQKRVDFLPVEKSKYLNEPLKCWVFLVLGISQSRVNTLGVWPGQDLCKVLG